MLMHRARACERGATAVEFAIVLVTLLIVLLGMLSIGVALWDYNTLSEATREGVRYGSTLGGGSGLDWASVQAEVKSRVQSYAFGLDLPASNIVVSSDTGSNTLGSTLSVQSSYTFTTFTPAFVGVPDIQLTSTATMRISN